MSETSSRPFAGFFEEAVDSLSFNRAPQPDVLGLARLPYESAGLPGLRNVCVECLRDRSACVCD